MRSRCIWCRSLAISTSVSSNRKVSCIWSPMWLRAIMCGNIPSKGQSMSFLSRSQHSFIQSVYLSKFGLLSAVANLVFINSFSRGDCGWPPWESYLRCWEIVATQIGPLCFSLLTRWRCSRKTAPRNINQWFFWLLIDTQVNRNPYGQLQQLPELLSSWVEMIMVPANKGKLVEPVTVGFRSTKPDIPGYSAKHRGSSAREQWLWRRDPAYTTVQGRFATGDCYTKRSSRQRATTKVFPNSTLGL